MILVNFTNSVLFTIYRRANKVGNTEQYSKADLEDDRKIIFASLV
jgi:hypothetical protein